MPDLYMPDVKVEIAFNAGYTTPAASRVWTDVSQYVELDENIDMEIGRQDERATADANTLTLTLDNSDGRFTAGRSGSPYFPNVKVGRPIRVTSTPVGGTASTRFVGFVDEWPVEWPSSDAYAKAKVRATSRLSRLGLTASLQSAIRTSILTPSPYAFWPMSDPQGSVSASEVSGRGTLGMLPVVPYFSAAYPTFGAALPWPDDATGVTLPAAASHPFEIGLNGAAIRSIRLSFTSADGATATRIIEARGSSGTFAVNVNGSGPGYSISVDNGTSFIITATGSAAPNVIHDLVLTVSNAGAMSLYLDGTLIGSASVGGSGYSAMDFLRVGPRSVLTDHTFTFANVALYDTVLTSTQVADQAAAVANGYAGERTDQRVTRLLGWVGVASSEVTVQTGAETMTYQKTDGQSVVDALRECESTEGGVLFDGRDGNVTLQNRSNRYLKTATATLNMAAQHVERDYSPKLDRSTLTNDVTVSNPTTEQTARSTDTASQTEYGIATSSATSVASTYEAMQQKAAWTVASYAEPRSRVPSLTVDVLAHQGLTPSTQTLLGVNVGDLLAVTNAPTQAATTSPSYFVEGYSERIGPQSYEITYNLSPTHPALSTFVLDDTTRGVLDSSYVLAL